MRIFAVAAAMLAVVWSASAEEQGLPSALLVMPIHDAQVVRGDDGMDHVEYELLVVSMFGEPVTLTSVAALDLAGSELLRIEGDALVAATQTLFTKEPSAVVPASGVVAVDVDLILPPDSAPDRVTHRISYALAPESEIAAMSAITEIEGPEVTIDRRPAIVIAPPVKGDGWLAATACCVPNVHRSLRVGIDGVRIETPETFAIDWNRIRGERIYDGDGSANDQHFAYGAEVFAVADGTVVAIQDGKADATPNVITPAADITDFGGNQVILQIAPDVYALYLHLQSGSVGVKVGDVVTAGTPLARIGNTGPSSGPHLHFSIADRPSAFSGRSLPFVFDRYTHVGTLDDAASAADRLVILPDPREVRSAYPLDGSIQNYP